MAILIKIFWVVYYVGFTIGAVYLFKWVYGKVSEHMSQYDDEMAPLDDVTPYQENELDYLDQ